LRILVADDHQSVRGLVCGVLAAQEDWLVCGEATNGREGVEMALQLKPDVVILDISMPELNGLEAARQILTTMPQTNVVILTMYDGEDLRRIALESGAIACVPRVVMKSVAPSGSLSATSRAAGMPLCPGLSSIVTGAPNSSASASRKMQAMWSDRLPGENPSTSRTPRASVIALRCPQA